MTNEPNNTGTGVAVVNPFGNMGGVALRNPQAMASALAASAQTGQVGMAPDGSVYMNFSGKRGVYELGKDKEDIQADELWLVNIASIQAGYVCWKGGQPQATRLASIYGPPVSEPDFNEFGPFAQGDGWSPAKALITASVDRAGTQGYFKVSAKSAVGTISGLEEQVSQRMLASQPCWPLVFWRREKFQAKGNWNFKPTAEVYGWLNDAGVAELAANVENPEFDLDDLIARCEAGTNLLGQATLPAPEPEPEPVQTVVTRQRGTQQAVATNVPAAVGAIIAATEPTQEPAAAQPSQLAPGAARRNKRAL